MLVSSLFFLMSTKCTDFWLSLMPFSKLLSSSHFSVRPRSGGPCCEFGFVLWRSSIGVAVEGVLAVVSIGWTCHPCLFLPGLTSVHLTFPLLSLTSSAAQPSLLTVAVSPAQGRRTTGLMVFHLIQLLGNASGFSL